MAAVGNETIDTVKTTAAPRQFLSVDLGWQNIAFALRTGAAAVIALAIAYWLQLSDPQWATLTVYVLAQPTVGAALAKGVWRTIGTISGGIFGLVLVSLFSQAPELLVAATVLTVGASFYAGARLRNYPSYGVLLGGYTALLVAFEGSADPLNAWSIAGDRTTEILIGIACSTTASVIVFPRYASDTLREALSRNFAGLLRYVATALRLSAPAAVFAQLRQRMVADVISFDALCSYAMYEVPEMRGSQQRLQRAVREFLMVLAIGRGLFRRLDVEDSREQVVLDRLRPTLETIAASLERTAADQALRGNRRALRRELVAAHAALRDMTADLESMAGSAPFEPLANGLLIVRRVGDLLHGLARVVVAEAASFHAGEDASPASKRNEADPKGRQEALLLGIRAALAMLVMSVVWMATGWNEGFTALSGGAIMLFFGVNQDDPQTGARTYLIWTAVGTVVGYLVMILLLPQLQGFTALAVVLLVVLLPAGLMAGTPRYAWAGIAFGAFLISQVGTGNVFTPDELSFINNAVALILGMAICLAVIAAMPVTSRAKRSESWQRTIGAVLPAVARGETVARRGADAIVTMLAALLPRLALDRQRDEDFFRGTLGAASSAVELGRLVKLTTNPAMPKDVADALGQFLTRFAIALESISGSLADRQAKIAEAEAIVADIRTDIAARPLEPGAAARAVLQAGSCLRFIADRFYIDRGYFELTFAGDSQ